MSDDDEDHQFKGEEDDGRGCGIGAIFCTDFGWAVRRFCGLSDVTSTSEWTINASYGTV